jgi:hypothetical protein
MAGRVRVLWWHLQVMCSAVCSQGSAGLGRVRRAAAEASHKFTPVRDKHNASGCRSPKAERVERSEVVTGALVMQASSTGCLRSDTRDAGR